MAWICVIVLAGLYMGWVPSVNRSVLFILPWLGAAVLALLPTNWLIRAIILCVIGYALIPKQIRRLKSTIRITQDKLEGARTLHESWGQQQAGPVVFRPHWSAPDFLSSLVNLRFAPYSSLEDGPTPLPVMYAIKKGGDCSPGERGISFLHGRQPCDCPVEAETKLWTAYACPE